MKKQLISTKKSIVIDWETLAIRLVNNAAYTILSKIKYISMQTNFMKNCLLINKTILAQIK